jgi:hypothetical protein
MDTHLSSVSLFLGQRSGVQKMRDEALSKTDPHSPGMYRAYVPLQNIDTFIKLLISKKMTGCSLHLKNV